MWDGCSDVLKKRLNSLHRRAAKLIFPDTTLTTEQKLKEMRIKSLQKQPEYNKGLFMYRVLSNEAPKPYIYNLYTHTRGLFMYRVLSNEAPKPYISNLYTHTLSRYSNSRNYHLSLPRPRIDILKTSISFSGAYLWNNLPLLIICN